MPLETGVTISDLDETWPLGGDFTSRGDDHLRLIKSVLKTQFPGSLGDGFDIPITATEAELNSLTGVSSNIQDQIDSITTSLDYLEANLSAPTGTVMLFYQPSAPANWTQLGSLNDYMLRVVSGAGGVSGGSQSPISANFTHTHTTADHALTINEMPAHTHQYSSPTGGGNSNDLGGSNRNDNAQTGSTGGGLPHNHGPTGSASITFTPRYIDVIMCSKDADVIPVF